jgi:hypothetical protein
MKNNLANYYVLPLLGLNKASFGGSDNFINSYITSGEEIVVEVLDEKLVAENVTFDHPNYLGDIKTGETYIFLYDQPDSFKSDILLFAQGKYSEMSIAAKGMIIKHSGLPNNLERKDLPKKPNGRYQVETSKYILGLDKTNVALRAQVENQVGQSLPKDAELIEKPNSKNFYVIPE